VKYIVAHKASRFSSESSPLPPASSDDIHSYSTMMVEMLKYPPGISQKDVISSGTSGRVALLSDGQTVIKFPWGLGDDDDVARCKMEGRIYEVFHESGHPGRSCIVGYRGKSRCGSGILLEYLPNTVRHHLQKNGVPESSLILRWASEVVEALCFVHLHGISHGDVNCGNLLLDHNLSAKLGDFTNSLFRLDQEDVMEDIFEFGLALYEISTGIELFPNSMLSPTEKKTRIDWSNLDIHHLQLARTISNCLESKYLTMEEVRTSIRRGSSHWTSTVPFSVLLLIAIVVFAGLGQFYI
jgi:serine/threonine protein kinase